MVSMLKKLVSLISFLICISATIYAQTAIEKKALQLYNEEKHDKSFALLKNNQEKLGDVGLQLLAKYYFWSADDSNREPYIKSFEIFQELEDSGALQRNNDGEAQFLLAVLYLTGFGGIEEPTVAEKWFKLSMDNNYFQAYTVLADYYLQDSDLNLRKEGIRILQEGVDKGLVECAVALGRYYYYGKRVKKDLDKAYYYYRIAAEKDDAQGMYLYGDMVYTGFDGHASDKELGLSWLKKSADKGYVGAQALFGNYSIERKDYSNALKYLNLAAEQGFTLADGSLGALYLSGGVPQDTEKAIEHLSIAANAGDANSQLLLAAVYYYGGEGTPVDYKKAFSLFKKASENGKKKADCYLGICSLLGQGTKIDTTKAKHYLRLSADRDDVEAQRNLGILLINHPESEDDIQSGLTYLEAAAEKKDKYALYELGTYYAKLGGKDNEIKGVAYLATAAKYGDGNAAYLVGWYYENYGDLNDPEVIAEIRYYYGLAVASGFNDKHDVIANFNRQHPMSEEKKKNTKIAILIGNTDYIQLPRLYNPLNDINDLEKSLASLGFETRLLNNLSRQDLYEGISRIEKEIHNMQIETVLVFYSGHGAAENGWNYIIPIDYSRENKADDACIQLSYLVQKLRSTYNIVIFDACRTKLNSDVKEWSRQNNLPSGTMLTCSVAPGYSSPDGMTNHSPYTESLLKKLREVGDTPIAASTLLKSVQYDVYIKTGINSSFELFPMEGEFYFSKPK